MYEALVARLRCQLYGNCPACVNWYTEEVEPNLWRERCAAIDAADAIEELTDRNVGKWIPVTERLPEDLTRVIVFCEDGVSYGLCEHLIADDEEVVEWHDFLHYPITPTHWMPLPEPPKEE